VNRDAPRETMSTPSRPSEGKETPEGSGNLDQPARCSTDQAKEPKEPQVEQFATRLHAPAVQLIRLEVIKADSRAQPRSSVDRSMVLEYAEAMKAGATFPPLTVFNDGADCWLADGFHRHAAMQNLGICDAPCAINEGGLREAILYACRANATHGLRRSAEDKRRVVELLLADPEWSSWSDREIARQCIVSHSFVARVRAETTPVTVNEASEVRTFRTKHGTTATMRTAAIGGERRDIPELSLNALAWDLAQKISGLDIGEVVASCSADRERERLRGTAVSMATWAREIQIELERSQQSR